MYVPGEEVLPSYRLSSSSNLRNPVVYSHRVHCLRYSLSQLTFFRYASSLCSYNPSLVSDYNRFYPHDTLVRFDTFLRVESYIFPRDSYERLVYLASQWTRLF